MIVNLRATSAPDFLATVPAVAGFSARNSIVCVLLREETICAAVRIDLPAQTRESSYRAVADALISLLGETGVDHVVPVIYTDETFERERGIPRLNFARLLRKRLHNAGFPSLGAFCVAADGWASYLDRDYPREGRPLQDIEQSKLAQQLGETIPNPIDVAQWGQLPSVDTAVADEVYTLISLLKRSPSENDDPATGMSSDVEAIVETILARGEPDPVSWVEVCVALDHPVPLEVEVWLLLLAQSPARRDLMMVQFAFGRAAGELAAELNTHYEQLQRETGLSMDEIATKEFEVDEPRFASSFSDKLIGECPDLPDLDRVYRAIDLLSHVTAHAPESYRPAPLTMIAWLFWCLGMGSVAGRHLDDALRIEPGYGMAQVLATLISGGRLPRWIFPSRRDGS